MKKKGIKKIIAAFLSLTFASSLTVFDSVKSKTFRNSPVIERARETFTSAQARGEQLSENIRAIIEEGLALIRGYESDMLNFVAGVDSILLDFGEDEMIAEDNGIQEIIARLRRIIENNLAEGERGETERQYLTEVITGLTGILDGITGNVRQLTARFQETLQAEAPPVPEPVVRIDDDIIDNPNDAIDDMQVAAEDLEMAVRYLEHVAGMSAALGTACPVCSTRGNLDDLTHTPCCLQEIHRECLNRWFATQYRTTGSRTCPCCRARFLRESLAPEDNCIVCHHGRDIKSRGRGGRLVVEETEDLIPAPCCGRNIHQSCWDRRRGITQRYVHREVDCPACTCRICDYRRNGEILHTPCCNIPVHKQCFNARVTREHKCPFCDQHVDRLD